MLFFYPFMGLNERMNKWTNEYRKYEYVRPVQCTSYPVTWPRFLFQNLKPGLLPLCQSIISRDNFRMSLFPLSLQFTKILFFSFVLSNKLAADKAYSYFYPLVFIFGSIARHFLSKLTRGRIPAQSPLTGLAFVLSGTTKFVNRYPENMLKASPAPNLEYCASTTN